MTPEKAGEISYVLGVDTFHCKYACLNSGTSVFLINLMFMTTQTSGLFISSSCAQTVHYLELGLSPQKAVKFYFNTLNLKLHLKQVTHPCIRYKSCFLIPWKKGFRRKRGPGWVNNGVWAISYIFSHLSIGNEVVGQRGSSLVGCCGVHTSFKTQLLHIIILRALISFSFRCVGLFWVE